jgi:hypothetical protein
MKKRSITKPVVIVGVIVAVVLAGILTYILVSSRNESSQNEQKSQEKTCTTYGGLVEKQCVEDYIGLIKSEAIARAKQYKYVPKTIKEDGVSLPTTDERSAAIFFEVEKNIITRAYFGEWAEEWDAKSKGD